MSSLHHKTEVPLSEVKPPKLNPQARDFDALLQQLQERAQQQFGELKPDVSPSSMLGLLLDLFACVGDGLQFQLDQSMRQLFWQTVTDRTAAQRLAQWAGYRPKGNRAAVVTLQFSIDEHMGEEERTSPVVIPARTPVASSNGEIVFETLQRVVIPTGQQSIEVRAEHAHWQQDVFEGNGQAHQRFAAQQVPFVEGLFVENSAVDVQSPFKTVAQPVQLFVDGAPWELVEDFLASSSQDQHFRIEVNASGQLHVVCGDGLHGKVPMGEVLLRYRTGGGPMGNVGAHRLQQLEQALYDELGQTVSVSVTNPQAARGGQALESVDSIRRNSLLHMRSQQRAVTRRDLIEHALSISGVKHVQLVTHEREQHIPPHVGFLYVASAPSSIAPVLHHQEVSPIVGNAQVDVQAENAQQPAASPALLAKVQHHFQHTVPLPVGFVLHVVSGHWVNIDLALHVWLAPGTQSNVLKPLICDSLRRGLYGSASVSHSPWGQLPHASALVHAVHQAHEQIAGVQLLTDLSNVKLQHDALPLLGNISLMFQHTNNPMPQAPPAPPPPQIVDQAVNHE